MLNREEIAVVGYAARLPGAKSSNAFWSLLQDNRCAIQAISPDRFSTAAFYHPSHDQRGRSYTFAAGLIDDVWGFDAAAFGMSPREAEQVDPQQRHLLEVTYDALAHAGIRPSNLAGSHTGVFVGASSVDYGARFFADPSAADVHMMTGNTLSVIANRLSYSLNVHGPSFTVDTACSSSLVALSLATDAIRNGTIDTAIVGGVNLLLSPFSFVGFSRASMLSPTGLCRPFDSAADGYVRAEGVIALVLRSLGAARKARQRVHAAIVGSGVGQDGRTTGLSLPSASSQRQLLEQVYHDFAVDPSDLSFVEAHGTGTRVGDPIEADALGKALAQRRSQPLLIGSVKSNVGHLEPASGLTGVLKAIMALNRRIIPATLHQQSPSPDIPFDELNLRVVSRNHRLPDRRGSHLAGVNSFGFGGTNAHVILRNDDASVTAVHLRKDRIAAPLLLSAHAAEVLPDVAAAYAKHWPSERQLAPEYIAGAAHLRDAMPHRALVHGRSLEEVRGNLEAFSNGTSSPAVLCGQSLGHDLPVAFLFSGNGSQWAGMGRAVWHADERFRRVLQEIEEHFATHQSWSLVDMLFDDDLAAKLRQATYAQPLIFALQVATVRLLEESGLSCSATLGHSVGEIAAAWAAGYLSLDQAIDVVIARSRYQEQVRGVGGMAAVMLSERDTRRLLEGAGVSGVTIAAVNSWRSVTVSGPNQEIDRVVTAAATLRASARRLDLDYPFHSSLVDPVRAPLLRELSGLRPLAGRKHLVSSVTGTYATSKDLVPDHWWHNVRDPVQFEAGLKCLLADGYRIFVEVGPKPILGSYVRDSLREAEVRGVLIETLTQAADTEAGQPIERTVSKVLLGGGQVDYTRHFGSPPVETPDLPLYPWCHAQYKVKATAEATTVFSFPQYPLLGLKPRTDCWEWFSTVDTVLFPWIADHKVGGVALFPATAFIEVLLAAAKEVYGEAAVELREFDIVRPLAFDGHTCFETSVRLAQETGIVEFLSRPRGATAEWSLHARGIIGKSATADMDAPSLVPPLGSVSVPKIKVYEASASLGFGYGPYFQRVRYVSVFDSKRAMAILEAAPVAGLAGQAIDLVGFDAAFHALFASEEAGVADMPMKRMLPVRFGRVQLFATGVPIAKALARTVRRSSTSILANVDLLDDQGNVVLAARDIRLIEAPAAAGADANAISYRAGDWYLDRAGAPSPASLPSRHENIQTSEGGRTGEAVAEALLLLEAGSLRIAWEMLKEQGLDNELTSHGLAGSHDGATWPLFLRSALIWHLETRNLITAGDGRRLASTCDLPELDSVIRSLVMRHPMMVGEAAELSRLQKILGILVSGGADPAVLETTHWRQLAAAADQVSLLQQAVARDVAASLQAVSSKRRLQLLFLGANHSRVALDLADRFSNLEIVVTDIDSDRVEQARASLGDEKGSIRCIGWGELESIPPATIDIVCSIDALCEIAAGRGGLSRISRLLRPQAPLVAGELAPNVFWDIVRGTAPAWWARSANVEFPVGALLTGQEWVDELQAVGFSSVVAEPLLGQERVGVIIRGTSGLDVASSEEAPAGTTPLFRWEGDAPQDPASLLFSLSRCLQPHLQTGRGSDASEVASSSGSEAASLALPPPVSLVAIDARSTTEVDCHLLGQHLERIADHSRNLAPASAQLWVLIDFGSLPEGRRPSELPLWSSLTAALRVAQNEYPGIQLRCLGLSGLVTSDGFDRVVKELHSPSDEREVFFQGDRRLVFRVDRGAVQPARNSEKQPGEARRIGSAGAAGRGALSWATTSRAAPASGEVEIEVAATGLNFRDVMWNLRLLPEEAVEDGYVGPQLGMECSGTIARIGQDVEGLSVGDRVVAFVPGAFASHVLASAFAVYPLPPQLGFEAAATIPVAFLTAYYSLTRLAALKPGQIVLVHGGAGAVGLAALQIARLLGAKVIVTAGTEEKRALLRNIGADAVFSSRTLAFADQVMDFTDGKGVDVVLNSLAGEAMVRSMDCLKPFGRFVELGKRDFYANTHVGLRPFRRNLSYFGVDIDQLLDEHSDLTRSMFGELIGHFASGNLRPLPYRVFKGEHTEDAFRLMQRSGHIGKILVRPAAQATDRQQLMGRFPVDPDGLHVIVGGTSGFGLATAEWLANRGARHIALVSRSGRVAEAVQKTVSALRQRGVEILIDAVDATDIIALEQFFKKVAIHRPIKGVIHAAMVIDDHLMEGMDHASIEKVLQPKVTGAIHLDRLTRPLTLDYLLLYSSATTFLGNPGQYNYVAANAFLEGLARQRFAQGLPALAIAWGGIEDAGYLSRNIGSNVSLKKRFATSLLSANQALDGLDLAYDSQGKQRTAFCSIARIDWAMARKELAVTRAPAYATVLPAAGSRQAMESTAVLEKLRGMPQEQAIDTLVDIIVEEIARVLRLAPKEVDRHRPLGEIGMDSLMMLELRTTVETALQIELPIMSLANGVTAADIARRVAPMVLGDPPQEAIPGTLLALSSSHISADAEGTGSEERIAAARAVLERTKVLEGPL